MCTAEIYTTRVGTYFERLRPPEWTSLKFSWLPAVAAHDGTDETMDDADRLRSAYQRHYQQEVRDSRRTVIWATILSIGLAISTALVLYRLLNIETIL